MLASLCVPFMFAVPTAVAESGGYEYELINGDTEVKITRYLESDADPIMPDAIEGRPVTMIDWHAFYQIGSLESVTIPASISSVSAGAFRECWNFTAIHVNASNPIYGSSGGVLFDEGLKHLFMYPFGLEGGYEVPATTERIGYKAFAYCGKITSITIPDGLTDIQQRAFFSCRSLSSVTLGAA